MTTLADINATLAKNNKLQQTVVFNTSITRQIQSEMLKRLPDAFDMAERLRESQTPSTPGGTGSSGTGGSTRRSPFDLNLAMLLSPTGVLATLAAVGAATMGFRPGTLTIIRKGWSITINLMSRLSNTFEKFIETADKFRDSIRSIGSSEKLTKFFKPFGWISRLFSRVDDFFMGPGKAALDLLKGGAGKIFGIFKKIFWPIGLLFSAFDGVKAFQEEEGSLIAKLGAGIGAMLGDFVGAPFDLIKNGIAWIIGKLFGVESTDGVYNESTVTGRILNLVKEFSFEDLIGRLVAAPFKLVDGAWNWIKDTFADITPQLQEWWGGINISSWIYDNAITPTWNWFSGLWGGMKEHLSNFWGALTGGLNSAGEYVGDKINSVWNWFTGIWGNMKEGASAFWTRTTDGVTNIGEWIAGKVNSVWETTKGYISAGLDTLKLWFETMPARVSILLQEKWIQIKDKAMMGFINLAEYLAGIPDRILLAAANLISSSMPRLSGWLGIEGTSSRCNTVVGTDECGCLV